jgi:hypothetical protein
VENSDIPGAVLFLCDGGDALLCYANDEQARDAIISSSMTQPRITHSYCSCSRAIAE